MKKVLFVVPFLAGGGAERVVSIWVNELVKLNLDIHLIVFYRVKEEYEIDEKVNLHCLYKSEKKFNENSKITKLFTLRREIKNIKPNIVIPFISYVGVMVSIAKIGLPVKVIETIRIDPRYSPKKFLMRFARDLSVFCSSRCIVQTHSQLTYFPKTMHKRMVIFPNPISPEFINSYKESPKNELVNLIAVGRLESQKNYHLLISAFAEVVARKKNLKLKIYGEGSLKSDLINLIEDLQLQEMVELCGRTNNISRELEKSDLYILSSDAEGMPNSLMEAMAVGVPCISTNCPTGPSDLIESGINGILTPVGDKNAMINAIYFYVNNLEMANEIGKAARKKIIHEYSAEVSAKKLMNYINSI